MNILALDTSTMKASAALLSEQGGIFETVLDSGETHSRTLLPEIGRLLSSAGLSIRDIGLFAAGIGPGSFTGLRIGLSAAKGLAWAAEKPLAGVSSLDAMVWALPAGSLPARPIVDARKGQVYTALYQPAANGGAGFYSRVSEYQAVSLEELADSIETPTVFFGEGRHRWEQTLKNRLGGLYIGGPKAIDAPAAIHIARAGMNHFKRGEATDPMLVAPLYIRPPDIQVPKAPPCRIFKEAADQG